MDTLFEPSADAARLTQILEDGGVRWLAPMYPDIAGRPRGKIVPVGRYPELLAGSERYTPRGLDGLGVMNPVENECVTLPDPSRIWVLPWDPRCAVLPADLSQEGKPYPLCLRSVLKRQLARAAEAGYSFQLGVETELYVFQGDGKDPLAPQVPLSPASDRHPTPAYLLDAAFGAVDFLIPLVEAMNGAGFDVFSFDQEGGNGQFEFDFSHADALLTADRLLVFRLFVKEYARRAGGYATLMPKPSSSAWGSGAHFNMSLESLQDGRNLFRSGGTDGLEPSWTLLARSFAAGILAHAPALAAITNPTVNSYKRLVSSLESGGVSWAPVWISAGDNNRSCMIRFPRNRPAIENRLVDSAANTYLAAALCLAAGLDGIERNLELGDLVAEETYQWAGRNDSAKRLPRNLLEAVEAFVADPLSREALGDELVDVFADMKEREWEEYHAAVSDWELRRYLTEL